MGHSNSVFAQLQQFLPYSAFQSIISKYNANYYYKRFTCKNHLMVMLYAQLTGKESLRDIEQGLNLRDNKLYHLGIHSFARSSISRANSDRSYKIFEDLFHALLSRCNELSLPHYRTKFRFKNSIYAIDGSNIDLCLSLFPWSNYGNLKGAIKIHPLLNLKSQTPEFMVIDEGRKNDLTVFKENNYSIISKLRDSSKNSNSILVMDRGYLDYSLFKELDDNDIIFVSRSKKPFFYKTLGQHEEQRIKGSIVNDEIIELTGRIGKKSYPGKLRRIEFFDKKNNKTLEFITNNFEFSPRTIAQIYRARWDIELFFKWIKQNLKIKTFFGTSKNAVMTQIWIAMIAYLLLSYIKYQAKFNRSLLEITRIIKESLFENIHLIEVINLKSINLRQKIQDIERNQLELFDYRLIYR